MTPHSAAINNGVKTFDVQTLAQTEGGTTLGNSRAIEIAEKLNQAGVPPKFGPDISRLLIKVIGIVAEGQPVNDELVSGLVAEIGIDEAKAAEFLRSVTERDDDDNIVGIVGLSQNPNWAHRFNVNGNSLRTWCAWDTLFIPLLLNRTATIESESPVSKETIRVTVSPDGVNETSPKEAVVSIVLLESDQAKSVEEVWSQFCHQVYFFTSREEGEQWTAGRDDIEILTVDEAFELGKHAWSGVLAYS